MGKLKLLCLVSGNVKMVAAMEESLKKLNIELPCDLAIPLLDINPE